MTDLHARFRRLDRVRTPDLWYEAVGRAGAVDAARRPAFNPTLALLALGLLLAALGGVVTVGSWLNRPAPVPRIVTYDNGMLVQSPDCGELVGIDPVTLAARQLVPKQTGCEGGGETPVWSLNGQRLAYVVPPHEEALGSIWVYEAPTGQSRQVADCRNWCSDVTISPDGRLIAYLDWLDEGPSLLVAGVDSGQAVQVGLIGSPRTPAFSPDGTRIALPLFGGRSGLYLVDVSRAGEGEIGTPYLLHGIVDASDAAWSPDGEWIAITQIGGLGELGNNDLSPFNGQISLAGQGIVVVRADGSEARILATGLIEHGPALPTWSADSSTVAYVESAAEGDGRWAVTLSTVGLDGSAPTRIWTSGCCVGGWPRPAWSPDGEWIALAVGGSEGVIHSDVFLADVFLISPDGADVRSAPGHPWEPVWQPIPHE